MSPQNTAVLDRRSLTLPDWRTALKRRLKRPKHRNWLMLALSGFSAWTFYLDLADHAIPFACTQGVLAVLWFVSSESRRARDKLVPHVLAVITLQTMFLVISLTTGL